MCKFDVELLEHWADLVLLEVHDGFEDLENWVENELAEGAFEGFTIRIGGVSRPLLSRRVEEVVAPQFSHHLVFIDTELLGVTCSELAKTEGPAVKTRAESDCTLVRVNLDIAEGFIMVSGNDDVHRLDSTEERLVKVFFGDLKFEKCTIDLVNDDDWFDALAYGLSEDSFCLDADPFDTVYDDESTVCHTKSCSDF